MGARARFGAGIVEGLEWLNGGAGEGLDMLYSERSEVELARACTSCG